MKIEAGKYYRVRRGDVVGPIQHNEHARDFPWVCLGFVWRKDGSYCELDPHVNDIVAEVYVRDTPPGVYASEAEQDRDVFFNRLGRITEELNLPMDATASRVIEAIRALSDTPPADVPAPEIKTLRDEFAGYAIIGLLAAGDCHAFNRDEMAVEAYRQADAMLEARQCWKERRK
jgi:hypothetical protein